MDLMIDIETLDTRRSALVLSIGYVQFEPRVPETFQTLLEHAVCDVIQLESQPNSSFSAETLLWWLRQSVEFKILLESQPKVSMQDALMRLSTTIWQDRVGNIWGNGPTFDLGIISHHYEQAQLAVPWKYYKERDVRTMLEAALIEKSNYIPEGFIAHRADHDAAYQAMLVQQAYKICGHG